MARGYEVNPKPFSVEEREHQESLRREAWNRRMVGIVILALLWWMSGGLAATVDVFQILTGIDWLDGQQFDFFWHCR
jgi:hypothetical protein